jgi:hypothetical protein
METAISTPKNAAGESKLCLVVREDLPNAGEFILEGPAKQILTDYFRETGTSPDDAGFVFGNTFGLNKFKEFIFKIDVYNSGVTDVEERIDGIRIYEGLSKRSYLPPPRDQEWLLDYVLMPVLKNGEDLYTIVPFTDPNIILSHGRPCPNECGKSFF